MRMQSLLIGLSRWMHLNEYSQNWVASSPSPRESSPKASPSSSSETPKLLPRDSNICFPEVISGISHIFSCILIKLNLQFNANLVQYDNQYYNTNIEILYSYSISYIMYSTLSKFYYIL